jgi:hypothetical protein
MVKRFRSPHLTRFDPVAEPLTRLDTSKQALLHATEALKVLSNFTKAALKNEQLTLSAFTALSEDLELAQDLIKLGIDNVSRINRHLHARKPEANAALELTPVTPSNIDGIQNRLSKHLADSNLLRETVEPLMQINKGLSVLPHLQSHYEEAKALKTQRAAATLSR